jgi:hypothetical protein
LPTIPTIFSDAREKCIFSLERSGVGIQHFLKKLPFMARRQTTEELGTLIETLRRVLSSRPMGTLFSTDPSRSRHWLWSSHVILAPDHRHLFFLTTTFSKLSRECRDQQPLILTLHAPNEDLLITVEGRAKWLSLDRASPTLVDFSECGLIAPDIVHDDLHTWHVLQLPLTHLRIQVPSHGIDLQRGRQLLTGTRSTALSGHHRYAKSSARR